jgi:hypothetical protein
MTPQCDRSQNATNCKVTVAQLFRKYPATYRTPKAHYRFHKTHSVDPILSQIQPISSLILSSYLRLGPPVFHSGFPMDILCEFLTCPLFATCHLNLFNIIIFLKHTHYEDTQFSISLNLFSLSSS